MNNLIKDSAILRFKNALQAKTTQSNSTAKAVEFSEENLVRFIKYAERFSSDDGSRNDSFMKICREGLALSIPEEKILEQAQRFIYGDFKIKEAKAVLKSQTKYHKKKEFKSYSKLQLPESHQSLEVARQIINSSKDLVSGLNVYVTLGSNLYKYGSEDVYQLVNENVFALELRKKMNSFESLKVTKHSVKEVLENIKAETLINSKNNNNFFLNVDSNDHFMAMKSKILNVSQALTNVILQYNLDPNFFSTAKLPFDFNPSSSCPIFISILNKILPDLDDQRQLQSWFAYHLLSSLKFGKFMLFVGNGANGKSVILKILRLLLGEKNVSSVPIERLSNKDRFSPVETHGKLANISDEMSGDSIDEAFIKNYVTGGNILAERKYDHPFSFQPTAKLTFSTNTIPRIKDKSDGFWRRILILEFKEQIKPEDQKTEYIEDKFWIENGELSGIFNWMLEGVSFIHKEGKLFEGKNSKQYTHKVQLSSNNAKLWLSENITIKMSSFLDRLEAYNTYRSAMFSEGEFPVTSGDFYKQIDKDYPEAIRQDNPIIINGFKRRGYYNLTLNTGVTPFLDFSKTLQA